MALSLYLITFVKFFERMLRFISFGSGSSGNCYMLYTDTDALLIDAGVGVRTLKKQFKEYGLNWSMVKHIILTHDHADHVKSVGAMSKELCLPVYATKLVHHGIDTNYCVRHKLSPGFARYFEKNVPFQLGEFNVTPFHVPHDSTDCVGFSIDCQSTRFCIITDAGHITDEMKSHISEANYLVIEANHDIEMLVHGPYPEHLKQRITGPTGHLSNTDCANTLAENITEKLRHVWLCHLSEENNHPELARKTVEQILRSYGIIAGKDFGLEVLKRKTPSEIYTMAE